MSLLNRLFSHNYQDYNWSRMVSIYRSEANRNYSQVRQSHWTKGLNHILCLVKDNLVYYPANLNLSYWWSFGSLAGICLVIQIITGLFLAMHYIPHPDFAFESVEHIMRNVPYGWLVRYTHANGASMMFIVLYLHITKALFLKSYFGKNYLVWVSGVVIFILTMATAFLGYVLPWGQMSYWAATVITNFTSVVPIIGQKLVLWLWGSHSVGEATLKRFYVLHFLLPFVILGLVGLHLLLLHESGSNDLTKFRSSEYVTFYPYFYIKDTYAVLCMIFVLSYLVLIQPNLLSHPDNYIKADPLVTPAHIVPEWYFLPFYAILRSVPSKELGISLMGASLLIFFILPIFEQLPRRFKSDLHTSQNVSSFISIFHVLRIGVFIGVFVGLGALGGKDIKEPYLTAGLSYTILYFFTLVVLPVVVNILDSLTIKFAKQNYSSNWNLTSMISFETIKLYLIIFLEYFTYYFEILLSVPGNLMRKYDIYNKIFVFLIICFNELVKFLIWFIPWVRPKLIFLTELFVFVVFDLFFIIFDKLDGWYKLQVLLEWFIYYNDKFWIYLGAVIAVSADSLKDFAVNILKNDKNLK